MKTATSFVHRLKRMSGILFALGMIGVFPSACGILGDKEQTSRTLSQDNGACLDGMGPLVEDYLDGNVDEPRWRATWDCLDDTIDLFKKFVQGSNATSYSPEDLRVLTQRFVFSKTTVTSAFIDGVLAVKASLLGGSDRNLTKDELDQYRGLVRFLRDESSKLIPHLKARKQNPTPENLRLFADAVELFGNHFADYLNTSKHQTLSIDKAVIFMRELASAGLKVSPERIEEWTRFGQDLKVLLVRGPEDGISGQDWTKILKMGFKASGAMIAYISAEGDDPLFQTEMIDRIHAVLKGSLADWNGVLPFTQLDKVAVHAPRDILPRLAEDFRLGVRGIMKPRVKKLENGTTKVFRPALAKILGSKTDAGIDTYAIQRFVDAFHTGMRANWHLRNIFADTKEDLYPADFENHARAYASRTALRDKSEIERLITIGHRYLGMHPAGTPEMLFQGQAKHSQNNLKRMSWFEIAGSLLLDVYATGADSYGKAAVVTDLGLLLDDFSQVLFSVGMYHPLKIGVDARRFREANLFMPNGNGDDKMNLPETAVYFAYIFSGSFQSSRIIDLTLKRNPCPMVGWDVPLKQKLYDVQCFRRNWLANFRELLMNMPRMQDDYNAMTQAEKDEFYYNLEFSAKLTGYDNYPISEYDITSYAGLTHFAEAVMQKFDKNGDGAIDRGETLDDVFPIFKREISVISKIKIDFVNKAVLLYLMQYGKAPKIGDLLKWALGFEFLKKFKARRIRVYQIFAALTPAGVPDPISQTPPDGVEGFGPALGFMANSLVKGLIPTETSFGYGGSGAIRTLASDAPAVTSPAFDLSKVDSTQLQGYAKDGPIIDPTSPYQEALEVLPQDL